MRELPVQPGDMIDGRFRVERLLGQGNMGAVFVARHVLLDQPLIPHSSGTSASWVEGSTGCSACRRSDPAGS